MKILLFFIIATVAVAHNYTLVNACTGNIPLVDVKRHMAAVFHDHIYNVNLNRPIAIYNGTDVVLNQTSSLQTDLIIAAIDTITVNNSTHCNWENIFDMALTPSTMHSGIHYLFLFYDSHWCGDNPYRAASLFRMHHVIVPIAIGPQTNMMDMYHIMGPCQKPRCYNMRDYLVIN